MENREDLKSIIAYLPVLLRSSTMFWPPKVVEALKSISEGPDHSKVNSGEVLSVAIRDMRSSLSLFELLTPSSLDGYALFFDDLMSREESAKWFGEVLPALANLLLQLPALLESHYRDADDLLGGNVQTGLRILGHQETGIVFLSQELIGALLACSFFCLFPVNNRGANYLSTINFDELFAILYDNYSEKQEHKIKCIVHYFERICRIMPVGYVSFERKVLPFDHNTKFLSYPEADFWSKSPLSLCTFKAHSSGLIEDQSSSALEVDFANKYIGGGSLRSGCVQEEIRFMISPELIVGMLFLPSMADNEAIEIVGAERFTNYDGYASTFRFSGDHVDKRSVDVFGRRETRIIAIDALCWPGMKQYKLESLLRETNKAFCGFIDQSKNAQYETLFHLENGAYVDQEQRDPDKTSNEHLDNEICIGIVTGNWGCGAFGGDPEIKAVIQWLAASQALRPFISYHTFGIKALQNVDQVSRWIGSHEWTVGDLWNMMVEYSSQRWKGQTNIGFFAWLVPSM